MTTTTTTTTSNNNISGDGNQETESTMSSRDFVERLLGQTVVCTMTNGRTATGRFVCIDRLKNIILADCECRQEICSSDYTQQTDPPVTATATRHLQQAMVPGQHLKSVQLLCPNRQESDKFAQWAALVPLSAVDATKTTQPELL